MPLIQPMNAAEDFEDKPVDNGVYDLRITSAKVKESNSDKRQGAKYIAFGIKIEGVDGAATVFHNLNIPLDTDEHTTQRMMMRDIRRFFRVFNIPEDAPIEEDTVADIFNGATGKCQVIKAEALDRDGRKTGEHRNELRLPRVQ